jgi:PKD repeat protein
MADTSTGNPTEWAWDFGDGSSASISNPTHQYDNIGTYTVTLTAKNAQGSSKFTKKNCIKVQVSKARQKSYILLS